MGQPLLKRLPFQEFHGDERLAFVFIDLVNRTDIGMIQSRGRTRLALETL
jgi:hypothetical protein